MLIGSPVAMHALCFSGGGGGGFTCALGEVVNLKCSVPKEKRKKNKTSDLTTVHLRGSKWSELSESRETR